MSVVGSRTISGGPAAFLIFSAAGALGRKSATAAAITTTSTSPIAAEDGVGHLGRRLHPDDSLDARAAPAGRRW